MSEERETARTAAPVPKEPGASKRANLSGRPVSSSSARRPRTDQLMVGRLQSHGRAPYQFRSGESLSYFVKLLMQRGEKILWGTDLERALLHSSTQPKTGDMIGVRRTGRKAVTITSRQRDAQGRVVSQNEQLAHRTHWLVEKVQFFTERAKLARRVRDVQTDARRSVQSHPELLSTYLTIRGAEEIAARRIADPKDRERFVMLVREAMAASIKKGEPLPTVRLREKPEQQKSSDVPSSARDTRNHDRTR